MDLAFSFISGILAAFSPCVIVLIPLVLYRFMENGEKQLKSIFLMAMGFIAFFIITGIVFSSLFQSEFQNGLRLALGIFFVALGMLSYAEKVNPLNFPLVKNPFLLGGVFALAISVNPCTLPFLSIAVGLGFAESIPGMTAFGLGLLAPAILFVIFGSKAMHIAKKGGRLMEKAKKLMDIMLVITGVYLALTVKQFGQIDNIVVSLFLLAFFAILLRMLFIVNSKSDLAKPQTLMLVAALALVIAAALVHCSAYISSAPAGVAAATCHTGLFDQSCEVCVRCAIIFGFAAAIGFSAVAWMHFAKNMRDRIG
ncbi:MAG TPA: hypothetical protein PLO51_03185 [Candidatus Micrarchaeota archaeon]|nr:hypothetical protein [Candidatus Micrarchaeota archaeon]